MRELALNSQAISGEWTQDALGLLEEVTKALPELSAPLCLPDLDEVLRGLFPPAPVDPDQDQVPEPPEKPTTQASLTHK